MRGSDDGGGGLTGTPRSSTGGRSPSIIKPSPFASTAAAAALAGDGCSSSTTLGPVTSQDEGEGTSSGVLGTAIFAGGSSSGQTGSVTSPLAPVTLLVVNEVHVGERLVDAAVDAASAVAPESRKPRKSGSSSGGTTGVTEAAAAAAAAVVPPQQQQQPQRPAAAAAASAINSTRTEVDSIIGWHREGSTPQQQQQQPAGRVGASSGGDSSSAVPDLISLDSGTADTSAGRI